MNYPFAYRQLAEVLYDALIDDAFYTTMERSVSGNRSLRREAMLRYYDYSMQEASLCGCLQTPDGQSWGASIWSPPMDDQRSRRKETRKKDFIEQYMGAASLATYAGITEFMDRRTRPCVPSQSWYLSIVGVAPACQGQGRGQHLLRPSLDQADRLDATVYLETFTPRNMAFYQRMGFQEAASFDEPNTGSRYWVMIRKPASQQPTQETEHVKTW